MSSAYVQRLIRQVIEKSESSVWESAVLEWDIVDCEEDEFREESCICGKENLRYLFTIRNRRNQNELFPIGSSCINKFERKELIEQANVQEQMFKLLHYVKNNNFISLTPDLFSRKLLRHLYEIGAFDTEYNAYDGEDDYYFILDMFNKKNKDSITMQQHKKIRAIIVASIRPFLINTLIDKTNALR